ncbi:MAG: DUF2461 domain-containing protein [Bacteroidales bacterium]|nr:DUF2461 domain-containing protein [Candidatus Cacconaster merdequi]
MQDVLKFLRALNENNNREWFLAHKSEYLQAKNTFEAFALNLLEGVRKFDDSIGDLTIKDITYRIYRDVRFSKDKSPYKCHMGVFICPGGKKSGYSGYYFHVSAADNGTWECGHIIAAGDYMTDPKVLKILREDIELGNGDFRKIIENADPHLTLDREGSLKNVPAGFPKDSPDAEYFRLKRFCLSCEPDDAFVTSDDLVERLVAIFKSAMPFIRYINRAIEYSREEN